MADTVQYRLERMHPELEDLEKLGLFSKPEILDIVKHRRKFEYRLKRPSPLKRDFIEYIDYEMQLNSLRRLRKIGEQNNKKHLKVSVSDIASVSRILDIYRQAVTRFKADLDLWFRYLEFCRTRRNGRMKKVLAQVIRFHPKVPGIWIYAAAWEFDQNMNVVAARALMQNGLRVCPTSEDLWVEYLRMELTYLNKLKLRKVALGEEKGSLVRLGGDVDIIQWKDENKNLFMPLEIEGNEPVESEIDSFRDQVINVIKTVYSGAVEAIPSSFQLRRRLYDICETMDLGCSGDLCSEILDEMKSCFGNNPTYWDWLARKEVSSSKNDVKDRLDKAIKVYEEALIAVASPSMFNLYTSFLMEHVALSDYDALARRLISVYERALESNCMNEDMACAFVALYLKQGEFAEARKIAATLCGEKMPKSLTLCITKVSVDLKCCTRDRTEENTKISASIYSFFQDVLSKAPVSEATDLWILALKVFATEQNYLIKLIDLAYTQIAKQGGGDADAGNGLPSAITTFLLHKDGIQKARDFYRRLLTLPHPGLSLYRSCIEMEESIASLGDLDGLANARRIYAAALSADDQNVSMWKDYHAMELKLGTAESSNAVFWRARKTLKNFPADFASSL